MQENIIDFSDIVSHVILYKDFHLSMKHVKAKLTTLITLEGNTHLHYYLLRIIFLGNNYNKQKHSTSSTNRKFNQEDNRLSAPSLASKAQFPLLATQVSISCHTKHTIQLASTTVVG